MSSAQDRQVETLSSEIKEKIDLWAERYPADRRRSAVLMALHYVQHDYGFLSRELMDAVADHLSIPPIWVYEAATFYSMFHTSPVGRHEVAVCTNISCMLRGGEDLLRHIENRLGIRAGESTSDGRIYLKKEEECLAACVGAPMMMVDHHYYEDLTLERVNEIIDHLD